MEEKFFRDKVDNYKIYGRTYWGAFSIEKSRINKTELNNNIVNRNNLVKKYNIKCFRNNIPIKKIKKFEVPGVVKFGPTGWCHCNHSEHYYTCNKKHIVIFSDEGITDDGIDKLLKYGYIEHPSIYFNIRTFMKIV